MNDIVFMLLLMLLIDFLKWYLTMKLTKFNTKIQSSLHNIVTKQPKVRNIVGAIDAAGGCLFGWRSGARSIS